MVTIFVEEFDDENIGFYLVYVKARFIREAKVVPVDFLLWVDEFRFWKFVIYLNERNLFFSL